MDISMLLLIWMGNLNTRFFLTRPYRDPAEPSIVRVFNVAFGEWEKIPRL
jgi:hypothetical protein